MTIADFGSLSLLTSQVDLDKNDDGTEVFGCSSLASRMTFLLKVPASAKAVEDTLDVYIDFTLDGISWVNAIHFTQVLGNDSAKALTAVLAPITPGTAVIDTSADASSGVVRPQILSPSGRVRWAVDGNTADFDFTVHALLGG